MPNSTGKAALPAANVHSRAHTENRTLACDACVYGTRIRERVCSVCARMNLHMLGGVWAGLFSSIGLEEMPED